MSMEKKWRFPASGHGERKGISSGDTEAFKKHPFRAFAREILQNSIDARDSDEEPTVVHFSLFEMNTNEIPGYQELKDQIRRCTEFWAHKPDYVKAYNDITKLLNNSKITCLRVSDYNTTGLVGVDTDEQQNNKFLALTKGTGVSEKGTSLAGGSKGMGKNAAFLMSEISTVFYSTRANQDINGVKGDFAGSIGVSELISGYVDDNIVPDRDYTHGTGYYSSNNLNSAIGDVISLGGYHRNVNQYGTDIYILGFNTDDDWIKEVINSLLDSFMATIVRGDLEVVINNIEINRNNLKNIIYNDDIIYKDYRSNIISQYLLLTSGDKVSVYDIDTDYGLCTLYVLPLSKEEEYLATHECVMVRHPLMKIKTEKLGASFRVSAMCIIPEGTLGEMLRSVENPQHIDWEPKRIKEKSLRDEISATINSIRKQIKDRVIECLQIGEDNPLDPNGAGDYLPDIDLGNSSNEANGNQKPIDLVSISKPKANETFEQNASTHSNDGKSLQPDIGAIDDSEDGDVSHPTGHNDVEGGDNHPGSETSGSKEGDQVIFKRQKLAGVRYKVISTNKEEGWLRIIFVAPIDFKTCYLNVNLLDDTNEPSAIEILEMKKNGTSIYSEDHIEYGPFEIVTNEKVVLDVKTNATGYFGSEVKIICK